MEKIFKLFPDLLSVITRVAQKNVAPTNSSKLLNLLLDPLTNWKLKIQLSLYVEAFSPLHNLCYWLETDATDVAFGVGERVTEFENMFPGGAMMSLPSTNRLTMEVSFL